MKLDSSISFDMFDGSYASGINHLTDRSLSYRNGTRWLVARSLSEALCHKLIRCKG